MRTEIKHWYDGWFYEKFIAPNQDQMFKEIIELMEPGKKIIDIGCGTGRFSFLAADKASYILGVDLSKSNIERARLNLLKKSNPKIHFEQGSIGGGEKKNERKYDYAVTTYVLHEIPEKERLKLLKDAGEIAQRIIIGDYLIPQPRGMIAFINEAVEFFAGRDHYMNYKDYTKKGGLLKLAKEAGMEILFENKNKKSGSHLVMLKKNN
ncbi:MAG: class I SAM-dependent methyltransferase [Ignavibacteriaceae bacterium]